MGRIPLGRFELIAPIGRGGQATVWRAALRGRDAALAVKVLDGTASREPERAVALHAEIRAVAGLDHPGIVRVVDAGSVDAEAAARSLGALTEGTPWLAMELMEGAPRSARAPRTWPEIRGLLLALLDALAHAHARGVVHRDVKASNVLYGRDGLPRLTDFGLVFRPEQAEQDTPSAAGTPVYMAPEQFRGQFVDQGPWTDLYALGCLGWALVTGRQPFAGQSFEQLMRAHAVEPLPALVPLVPVPDGLDAWFGSMIAKNHLERFQRAADAAWALASLPEPGAGPAAVRPDPALDVPTQLIGDCHTLVLPDPTGPLTEPSPGPARRRRPPPLPAHWGPEPARAPPIPGVGLGLFGLQEVPLVGRQRERDALWSALVEVHDTGAPAAVVLRGQAGAGKSRLARWLCRRVHELGVGAPFRALHDAGDPAEGLRGMLARHLRVHPDLRGEDLSRHLRWRVAEHVPALCELLDPPARPRHLRSRAQRLALVHRVVALLGEARIPVVWLDDVQWGADALELARWALTQPEPMLFALTVREEALFERPVEEDALDELLTEARAIEVPVGPLDGDARDRLVQALIGLDPELGRALRERTLGNPMFALALLGDWVSRGLLAPGPDGGFTLATDAEIPLPESIASVWRRRVERLLAEVPVGWRTALEVAAALGNVDADEWRSACAHAGTQAHSGLVMRLMAERLAVQEQGSLGHRWSLVHGMLRETLLEMAATHGSLPAVHRACAAMLADRGDDAAERQAHHLLAAGAHLEAAEALDRAAIWNLSRDMARAMRLGAQQDELLEAHADPDDPVRARPWLTLGRVAHLRNDLDVEQRYAERVLALARRARDAALEAQALKNLGLVAVHRGHVDVGIDRLRAAAALLAGRERALVLGELGEALAHACRSDEAIHVFREAIAADDQRGMRDWTCSGLAWALLSSGRYDEAQRVLESRWQLVEAESSPLMQGRYRHIAGLIREGIGDSAGAEARFREVVAIREQVGVPAYGGAFHLARVLLVRGAVDEAEVALATWAPFAPETDGERTVAAAGLCVLALRGREQEAEALVARLERADQTGDPWVAAVLRKSARALRAGGARALADRVDALADGQRDRCGGREAAWADYASGTDQLPL